MNKKTKELIEAEDQLFRIKKICEEQRTMIETLTSENEMKDKQIDSLKGLVENKKNKAWK